jgi:hypothetical protein
MREGGGSECVCSRVSARKEVKLFCIDALIHHNYCFRGEAIKLPDILRVVLMGFAKVGEQSLSNGTINTGKSQRNSIVERGTDYLADHCASSYSASFAWRPARVHGTLRDIAPARPTRHMSRCTNIAISGAHSAGGRPHANAFDREELALAVVQILNIPSVQERVS